MAYVPNFAYRNPVYQPAMRIIAAITNANPALVTTTFAHQYIVGTIVRIDVFPGFGMEQINQQVGTILTVPTTTTFTINIDTTLYTPFVIPTIAPYMGYTSCQVVPIGETNDLLTAATQNVLPFSAT